MTANTPGPAPETPVLDGLLDYLDRRLRDRAAGVGRTLGRMTERERGLVREAAVMGYVRGAGFGAAFGHGAHMPPDAEVVAEVVDACLGMPDLYPIMAEACVGGGAR